MKFVRAIVLVVCLSSHFAAKAASLRSEIEAVYAKFSKCGKTRDIKGAISLLHKSYRGMDADGNESNYQQTVSMMHSMLGDSKDIQVSFNIQQVQQYGDEVSAWVTMTAKMMVKQGSKWAPMVYKGHFVECLRKFDGKWQFVRSYEVRSL